MCTKAMKSQANKFYVVLAVLGLLGVRAMATDKPTIQPSPQAIVRKTLLTALIDGQKMINRVEIKEVKFAPHQKTGVHLHPCPVVGVIAEGTVFFQVEGEAAKTLKAGDAFFEPANRKIVHFDAMDQSVKFIAYSLLEQNDNELIKMLQ